MTQPIDGTKPYDRTLKSLIGEYAEEIIPELVSEARLVAEENTEIARTNLEADTVYLITCKDTSYILHIEAQTNIDEDMPYRMLLYYVELFGKYRLPIISIVLYLFEAKVPEPVFQTDSGYGTWLDFQHHNLCLWEFDAETYLRRRVMGMYALLPGMKGINVSMLLQAIDEMQQHYNNEKRLGYHLWRFRTILHRSTLLTDEEKQIVEERLHMFDKLLDQDPDVLQRMARAEAKGKTEGKTEGKAEDIIAFIQVRFPSLAEDGIPRVAQIRDPEKLHMLFLDIITAHNEQVAREILTSSTV